ncbi:UDP-4-amino-4-deoxy-L-arabinose--oxoglutarate aminotransferase [Tepidimonas taiwanensis]|uniref:UDP-4-amino-4-deoxy-L-arabinose--oxoglutarate aminotransferase n=2 Tax=Tepidimonas taiwanensis TaxID=307486 RepID=A0A554X694_9BURK|nr:UDP-4-amino-4-deoxy-L-arabinose--oxoglutarate aminotransferase [Tepidimonas taiwanensis]
MRNIPIAVPCIGQEEVEAVREVLMSGWLTQGPRVKAFERAFAVRHRVEHALATTSCTTALHLALASLGIGPGDEVVVPAFTWIATANVVTHLGATPVFADVCRDTYNIDAAQLSGLITPRTKAVIVVHLFGLCADMEAVRKAVPPGIPIIEDAACAAGASYHGVPAGALGTIGCFSFHPRKSITCGEGGMLTTNDAAIAARAEILRNHGASIPEEVRHAGLRPWEMPDFDVAGYNYRMTDMQAAVGLVQLGRLDGFIAERQKLAALYDKLLAQIEWIRPPKVPTGYGHAWQAYVTLIDKDKSPLDQNSVLARLAEKGIGGRAGTHAVTRLGAYRGRSNAIQGGFPVADELDAWTMALPLHNKMTESDVEYVVEVLKGL